MCGSVLLILNIKLFFGIKHITQIKRYAIRRQINGCKHIYSYSFFQIPNIISKIAMPVLLFLISFFVVT